MTNSSTTFHDLGLSESLCKTVADMGFSEPTPIQAQGIPAILMNRDVVGIAQTGTGKTAAFTLPMVDILSGGRARARMPRSLILSPTRELAHQIAESFENFTKNTPLSMALLIGGTAMGDQAQKLLRGVDVLIATPGRFLDHVKRGSILLTDIQVFVIDEADRMMDMGFIPDIETIAAKLSSSKQTLFFSATFDPPIKKIAQKFLHNPKEVKVSPASSTAPTISQHVCHLHPKAKQDALRHFLKTLDVASSIVFCNRKKDVDILADTLNRNKFKVRGLHGDMTQTDRLKALDAFKTDKVNILVCSDVAARGLDIPNVSHVFNIDIPINAEDYVHRIGRTGRAGKSGTAISFKTKHDDKVWDAISKMVKTDIPTIAYEDGGRPQRSNDDRPERPSRRPQRKPDNRHKNNTQQSQSAPKSPPKNIIRKMQMHFQKKLKEKLPSRNRQYQSFKAV